MTTSGKSPRRPESLFDPARFAHLTEAEALRRIGALLATALTRSGRLLRRPIAVAGGSSRLAADPVDPGDLIDDPVERRIVRFLHHAGPTSPRDLATALGLSPRTTARRLAHLRSNGICVVVGQTQGARYQLRTDHSKN